MPRFPKNSQRLQPRDPGVIVEVSSRRGGGVDWQERRGEVVGWDHGILELDGHLFINESSIL